MKHLNYFTIKSVKDNYYKECKKLYNSFLPAFYRRNSFIEVINKENFNFKAIIEEDKFIGFISWWGFDKFIHGEHLIIKPEYANQGYEDAAFNYLKQFNKIITFEAMPTDYSDWAKTKMDIYHRNGFYENLYNYIQPPFNNGKPWADCIFMSYPRKLEQEEYYDIIKIIYDKVYNVNYDLNNPYFNVNEKYNSIINGKSTTSSKYFYVRNPANKEIIAIAYYATDKIIDDAVISSKEAFKTWKNVPIIKKIQIMQKFKELLLKNQGEIGDRKKTEIMNLIILEMGKSIYEAEIEIFETADFIDYYCQVAEKALSPIVVETDNNIWPGKKNIVYKEPYGVVAIIKPWNYPFELPMWSIIPALLSGNTVVFKPSEYTIGVGLYIAKLFKEAGLPDGVLNVIVGNQNQGRKLIKADIDKVSFQGSKNAGMEINKNCAKKMINCTFELGGKDSCIICDDADIERAVNGAMFGAFCNAGQVCVASELFYVHESIYDKFLEIVKEKTKNLKIGSGFDEDVDIATLSSNMQLQKVRKHVNDAVKKGAKIVLGGKQYMKDKFKYGFYYYPTILENISEEMLVFKEETFGPVMPLIKFNNYDEIIEKINQSEYGLGLSIYTKSKDKAYNLFNNINVGMCWINDVNVAYTNMPWSGRKKSGIGSELGMQSFDEYTVNKTISEDFSLENSQPWWYPYNK